MSDVLQSLDRDGGDRIAARMKLSRAAGICAVCTTQKHSRRTGKKGTGTMTDNNEEPRIEVDWTIHGEGSIVMRQMVMFGMYPTLLAEVVPGENQGDPDITLRMTFGGNLEALQTMGEFIKLAVDQYIESEGGISEEDDD